ncbi:hypothetical protein J4467_03965 [Candidatus Woesearchaeota archaeon]|nr:hypothetical protein [Candidatus Woesearchaeota archaeon]
MKKVLLLGIFLLFIPFAISGSVTLNTPIENNITNATSITFSCTASDTSLSVTSIALYTNESGSMSQVAIDSTGTETVSFTETFSVGNYLWNCLATFSDASTAEATSDNTFTIHALNYAGTIPNQTIAEDSSATTAFDLDTYFTNARYYTIQGNYSINLSINSNNEVLITPSTNYTGTQTIIISGHFNTVSFSSNPFLVNITEVNDNPYLITDILNQSSTINTSFTININQYFTDIDSELNYTINSTSFTINKTSSSSITIIPHPTFSGTKQVTITATDGSLTATSNAFTINISSAEESVLTIESYSPEDNLTLETGEEQEFEITPSTDGGTLTYLWTLNSDNVSTSSSYKFTAEEEGTYSLVATVSNGNTTDSKIWTIIVGSDLITTEEEIRSILSESSENAVCGNGVAESGETCSTCTLDVICPSGSICTNGTCQEKQSALTGIIILALVTIGIVIIGILIYYVISVKPTKNKPQQFQYRAATISPPANFTDFYKKK